MNWPVCFLLFIIPLSCFSETFIEEKDDFDFGKKYTLIMDDESGKSTLFLSCFPDNKLAVHLRTKEIIFPDKIDMDNNKMFVNITFNFMIYKNLENIIQANKLKTNNMSFWAMNMMKYHDAWFQEDPLYFLERALFANQLNLRIDNRGDLYRFNIMENKNNILAIMQNCGHKKTVVLFKSLIPENYLSQSDMLICNSYNELKDKNKCVIELLNEQ